jgi:hypothetical protein
VHPDIAPILRVHLRGVAALLTELDPKRLPAWTVQPEQERWAVEATRRFLFLRLTVERPPMARALSMLIGAVLCGWAHPEPERFGPALASWSRVMRTDALAVLFPDDASVKAVVRRV